MDAFSRFVRQKTNLLAVKSRRILEVFTLQVKKSSGRIFTIFASKNEDVSREIQTQFGSSLPAIFKEIVLGAISRVLRPKTNLFAVKFRHILEVFAFQALQKKFWAHFPDLCVHKCSCLPWSSDAFWKFSACKSYRKSFGHNFSNFGTKMKLFAVKFRRILEVFAFQAL